MATKTVYAGAGSNITILVRAVKTDPNGNSIYSDFASYPYTVPTTAPSGGNFTGVNYSTDIQLSGGSLYAVGASGNAGFSYSTGGVQLWDSVTGPITQSSGTGLILNQYGIGAYKSGSPQFVLDATNGNASFSGTIQATIIQSTGYTGLTDGSAYSTTGTAFNLNNGSITSKNFRIDTSGNAYFAGSVIASATIAGTLASTVVSNAYNGNALVATALKMVGTAISSASGQIQTIDTNGTTFYSGTSSTTGSRILINQYGILGYDTTSTTANNGVSFAIISQSQVLNGVTYPAGSAYFSGNIAGSAITGSSFITTSSGGNYIEMGTGGIYNTIFFRTSGASQNPGQILTSGSTTATHMDIFSPQINSTYPASQISLYNYSTGQTFGNNNAVSGSSNILFTSNVIDISSSSVVSSSPTTNGLKGIKSQQGGTASGGNNGDIILIYA